MSRGTRSMAGIQSRSGRNGTNSPKGTGCRLRYSPANSPSLLNSRLTLMKEPGPLSKSPPTNSEVPNRRASSPISAAVPSLRNGSAGPPVELSAHTTKSGPGGKARVSRRWLR